MDRGAWWDTYSPWGHRVRHDLATKLPPLASSDVCMQATLLQSCLTLCNPTDHSPQGGEE